MLYCKKCGGETTVYSTRETDRGQERRRECKQCGHRFKTLETVANVAKPEEEKAAGA